MAKHKVYTFYAELNNYQPKIYRRFEINGERTMDELCYALMIMFEMQGAHLFALTQFFQEKLIEKLLEFSSQDEIEDFLKNSELAKNIRYEFAFGEDIYLRENERLLNPTSERLQRAVSEVGTRFLFEYDYGDGWEILLTLESIHEEEISLARLPRVTEGEGFGIIEDVGGVGGLEELAKALKQGKGEEYNSYSRWLDSTTLNLALFDQEDCNFRLKKLPRIYRDIYQFGYEPTQASIKLLTRAYLGKGKRGY